MAWYLNPALTRLRAEVNARWPNRDRRSDGTIGDAAHRASVSDHNPDPDGTVDAWDMDIDGVDVWAIIDRFEEHPAARYWIYNRRIATRDNRWRRERYHGDNPHDKHVHFNTRDGFENSTKPWGVHPPEDDMPTADEIAQATWTHKFSSPALGVTAPRAAADWAKDARLARRDLLTELAAVRAGQAAILAAVQGLDSAAVLARIDDLAQAEAGRAAAEVQRDADLRELIGQADSGQLAAEEVVRRIGEILTATSADQPDSE